MLTVAGIRSWRVREREEVDPMVSFEDANPGLKLLLPFTTADGSTEALTLQILLIQHKNTD
jgi:hypothetical protein